MISPFVIHRVPERINYQQRKNKEHWTQIENRYLTQAFKDARDIANPYPKYTDEQQPGFHEIRALSSHLYKQLGSDPQKLLGHSDKKTTKVYADGHATVVWNNVEAGLKLPF